MNDKQDDGLKEVNLIVRVTRFERERYHRAARLSGVATMSDFVREALAGACVRAERQQSLPFDGEHAP